jgi:hypothetical protein
MAKSGSSRSRSILITGRDYQFPVCRVEYLVRDDICMLGAPAAPHITGDKIIHRGIDEEAHFALE